MTQNYGYDDHIYEGTFDEFEEEISLEDILKT